MLTKKMSESRFIGYDMGVRGVYGAQDAVNSGNDRPVCVNSGNSTKDTILPAG